MATTLTSTQWVEILQNDAITRELDIALFQTIYPFEGHKAVASQVGRILKPRSKSPHGILNLEVGRYAKRIAQTYEIEFSKRDSGKDKFWDLFFLGWHERGSFVWQLRPELVAGLEETELTGDRPYPDELLIDEAAPIFEGAKRVVTVNVYERNRTARTRCADYHGWACAVCNFDFRARYGELGKDFIHVHHIVPLADVGKTYEVNPITDLRPVCPNCHAMLHRGKKNPLTIEELKVRLVK